MSTAAIEVDPSVWKAIAGSSVQIPPVNSYVYYFTQGHIENFSSTSIQKCNLYFCHPIILCKLLSVQFLAVPSSDQLSIRMRLQPVHPSWPRRRTRLNGSEENEVLSYTKILTPSDTKNEGGFFVPRYCADLIFPRLDLSAEPPMCQNLVIKDTFNYAWEFRHVYRGTPPRHMLTTGWNMFVNNKQLAPGDSVVFMSKTSTNELFIGVRRGACPTKNNDRWNFPTMVEEEIPFEVVYYPMVGMRNFVVSADKVDDSMDFSWALNMRVKMMVETQEFSSVAWFQGTVTDIDSHRHSHGTGFASPWRMLQVTWDQPEIMQNMNTVSPWEVEHVLSTPQLHPSKKLKSQQNSGILLDEEEEIFHMNESCNSSAGHMNLSSSDKSHSSASLQGARLDQNASSHKVLTDPVENVVELEPSTVSTLANNGNLSSEKLSLIVQNSIRELVGLQGNHSSTKVVVNSFKLFGKTIHIADSVESGVDNSDTHEGKPV
ncbi:unnamed protein product [Fraxinus pennsylvanica]|uniref:Auxin response factor n=1 Tax=Fraxinus pennsylvanica TaxID=56036 RepID=A0AAD1ZBK0_9LAMI|nr:unnamed protein product [Fraxinus pennsylvanica]